MVSRRCCCKEGCDCDSCTGGKGPCCFLVAIGEATYSLVWVSSCTWDSDDSAINLVINSETLTITHGENTYSLVIGTDYDCKGVSNLEVPNEDGVSASAYVTADANACYNCWCYCDQCAEKYDGKNAACCWLLIIDAETAVYLSRNSEEDGYDGCIWSGTYCDGTESITATLSISSGSISLDINGDVHTIELESPPECCGVLNVDGYPLYPLSETDCTSGITYDCVQATISGVVNTCSCGDCQSINGKYNLTWIGTGYVGTLCTDSKPYKRCDIAGVGWNLVSVGSNHNGTGPAIATIQASYILGGEVEYSDVVTWSGTADGTLSYVSGPENSVCDFTGSTITLSYSSPCGSTPCGDSELCAENDCASNCKDCAAPTQYQITIPKEAFPASCGITEDQVFLLTGSMFYRSGSWFPDGYYRNMGATSCCSPSLITIFNDTYTYLFRINIYFGTYGSFHSGVSYIIRTPNEIDITAYCPTDHGGNFDCWLYNQIVGATFIPGSTYGSCMTGWNTGVNILVECL